MDEMREFTELTPDQAESFIRYSKNDPFRDDLCREIKESGGTVLDVACGNGNDSWRYSPTEYTGVDISQPLLDAAQKYCPKHKFILSDVSQMPFEDEAFDNVFCVSFLEHLHNLEDTRDCFKEMVRVAKRSIFVVWHNPPYEDKDTEIRSYHDKTGQHFGLLKWSNWFNTFELTDGIITKNMKLIRSKHGAKFEKWRINK